jgi:nucleotide-binding universal stress UspA family protein
MYQHILIPLENSATDQVILDHIKSLVTLTGARLLLLHVADGWVARNFNQLKLAESEEMKSDREYLEKVAGQLRGDGFSVETMLALGDPPAEIVKAAEGEHCDLIALAGHGHRLFGDIFHGSTITEVRHKTSIPILVVRAPKKQAPTSGGLFSFSPS